MSLKFLIGEFQSWQQRGATAVLATVTRTAGSTYTKAGAQMLVGPDDVCHGLLSGGCLEGDLAERSRAVRDNGAAQTVTYDMRNRDRDEIWGLGLGCDGAMDVLLTRLDDANEYAPFAHVADAVLRRQAAAWVLVVASTTKSIPVGASLVATAEGAATAHLPAAVVEPLAHLGRQCLSHGETRLVHVEESGITVLAHRVPLPPSLVVAGAGPDVVPVVKFACELGWDVSVVDHRPSHTQRISALNLGTVHTCRPGELASVVALNQTDAVLIMSHHLASDREYLQQVAASRVPYVGLLGPPPRRERLLEDLGSDARDIRQRLYAPLGLDIGGSGPAAIALAAVAEIHAVLNRRMGAHFDPSDHVASAKPRQFAS